MSEANVVSPSPSSKAMHVLSAVPNQRWLLSVLVSCGVCQGLVVAVKIWSKRRQLRAPNKQHNGQPTSSARAGVVLPRDNKSVAAGNNDEDDHFEDAEAYALCNHISSHVLGDDNEEQQEPADQQLLTAPSFRALHLLRRWDVVLTRVCPLQHASSTVIAAPLVAPQQSLSLLFPGTFHAFEEDILHFLSTWSETVDKRLRVSLQNTLMMGEGGSGSALWWHNMLVDVSWCVLFLIARRDCLVEFHVGVQVLRDTKYCSEHAVDKWVELHDVRVGGRHHFGFMENNGLTQLFQKHFEKITQRSHHNNHSAGTLLFAVFHHLNAIWNDQQRQYAALTAQYRTLQWRGMRSLLHYVLISSPSKWGILSLSTLSSLAVAKLAVSGVWIRRTVEVQLVSKVSLPPHSSSANSNHTDEELGAWKYLSYLVLWESLRLVALRLVKATTDKAIASWSAQERETRRRELYRCLVAQPLSYFDLYHYDDIEEVMFYVNDMEGVDVHVHTSLLRLQQSVLCLVQVAGETSVLTVAAASAGVAAQTVAGGLTVLLRLWWAAIVKKCSSQLNGGSRPVPSSPGATTTAVVSAMPVVDDDDDNDEEVDMEELENAPSGTAASFLSGGDILMDVHRLRPYNADTSLMDAWCCRMRDVATSQRRHLFSSSSSHNNNTAPEGGSMVRAALGSVAWLLVRTTESMPDAVDSWLASIPMLSRWLIPLLLPLALRVGVRYVENHQYMMSATAAPLPNTAVMLETMRYVEDVVAAVRDIPRLYDLIVRNGHKALVLETLQAQAAQEYKGKLDNNVESGLVEEDGVDDVAKSSTNTLARRFQQGEVGGGDTVVIINAIHFHNVSFAYPSKYLHLRLPSSSSSSEEAAGSKSTTVIPRGLLPKTAGALTELSVSLPNLRGHLVCITGPSGCGKSTMLNLLLALYRAGQPHVHVSGSITLEVVASTDGKGEDATDDACCSGSSRILLDTVPHDAVRTKLFGYVPQHPTILAGTIAQNVAMIQSVTYGGSSSVRGGGQPTSASVLQRVRDACQQAQCASFVAALPDGLLTFLAPSHSGGGANSGVGNRAVLSGGQAQRIMIARSLYQGCRILLMDEPTSALDAETKSTLVNDLKRLVASERGSTPSSLLLAPQTIIAVTHDEALLAMADVVVDLRR